MTGYTYLKPVLVGLLAIGLLGAAGPAVSMAQFSDSQNSTGQASAADAFYGNGPTADAGGSYEQDEGNFLWGFRTWVFLDGSASSAGQGDGLIYQWEIVNGQDCLESDTGRVVLCQLPGDVQGDLQLTVRLTVSDDWGRNDTDTTTITVRDTDGETASSASTDRVSTTASADENSSTPAREESTTATPVATESVTTMVTPTNFSTNSSTGSTPTETPSTTMTATSTATPTSENASGTETDDPSDTETNSTTATPTSSDDTATATPTSDGTRTATPQRTGGGQQ